MAKYAAKTHETDEDVGAFIATLADERKRAGSAALIEMMSRLTGEPPKLWGGNIVGFGRYHYKYASGHEGDTALIGFSPRKAAFSLYLVGSHFPEVEAQRAALLDKLGKHEMGTGCLYVKRLSDIDMKVLEELAKLSVEHLRAHYRSD